MHLFQTHFISKLLWITVFLLITADLCEPKRIRPNSKKKLLTTKIKATFKIKPMKKATPHPVSKSKPANSNWPNAGFDYAALFGTTLNNNANSFPVFETLEPSKHFSYSANLPFILNDFRRADLQLPAAGEMNAPLWQPQVVYKILSEDALHPRRTNIQQGYFAGQPLFHFTNPVDFNFANERFVLPSRLGNTAFGNLG